jgi:hypothetical protein
VKFKLLIPQIKYKKLSTEVIVPQRINVDTESHTLMKTILSIPTIKSQEDPTSLMTVRSTIMIVVHSIEVSTMHSRIVISSPVGD